MLSLVALAWAAPTITSTPDDRVEGITWYGYGIVVDDPQNEPLTVTAPVLPTWLDLEFELEWTTSTFAGGSAPEFPGGPGAVGFVDGPADIARFRNMYGITASPDGHLYVADTHNHAIRRVDGVTGEVTTLAGTGSPGAADGVGTSAELWFPQGISAAADGQLYVADAFNHAIRQIDPTTGTVTTVAGLLGVPGFTDGDGPDARFNFPKGVTVGPDGTLYVSDSGNHTVRHVDALGEVTTLAGSLAVEGADDGIGTAATFRSPRGLDFGPDGRLYIADKDNHLVRTLDVTTLEVQTYAGTGISGEDDGPAALASFFHPFDVGVDAAGTVFVADSSNHDIRSIDTSLEVSTIAGGGTPAYLEGLSAESRFYFPRAVTLGPDDDLFVSDRTNGAVRHLQRTDAQLVGLATSAVAGPHPVQIEATTASGSDTQGFTIDVVGFNTRPTISGTPTTLIPEGTPYSFLPTADDADGDPLSFEGFMIPAWATFDPATGEVSGTPGFDDAGLYIHVAITVDDGQGADNSQATLDPFNIRVTDTNRAPTLDGTPPPGSEGAPYVFQPVATDPDGDSLAFSATQLPGWATLDPSSGTIVGTPDFGDAGVYAVLLTVDDATDQATLEFKIEIAPVNRPPTISGTPASTVDEGSPYSFLPVATDPDGDSLEFSGTALPAWCAVDPVTGEVFGTPSYDDAGAYPGITLTATDRVGAATTLGPFDITVVDVNRAPTANSALPDLTGEVTELLTTPVPADACIDPDGDALTYRLDGPSWVTLVGPEMQGTPPADALGSHTIELFASDGDLETLCDTFVIDVVDTVGPAITLVGPLAAEGEVSFDIRVASDEPIEGLDLGDFVLTAATATTLIEDGMVYVLTVTPSGDADIQIELPAGAAMDAAGNPSTAAALNVPWSGGTAGGGYTGGRCDTRGATMLPGLGWLTRRR